MSDGIKSVDVTEVVVKAEETRNDRIAAGVVDKVEYFSNQTLRILHTMGIGTLDGNFESLFHNIFNTMVAKYSQEVNG